MLRDDDIKLLRDVFQGVSKTLRAYSQIKAERMGKMKVEYRNKHHDDKPCEREIVIPDGWELCSFEQAIRYSGMSAVIGEWVKTDIHCVSVAPHHIRPIKRIELEVGAWYERSDGIVAEAKRAAGPFISVGDCLYSSGGIPHDDVAGRLPRILRRVWVYDAPQQMSDQVAQPLRFDEKPFHLSGPGWYRDRIGGWHKRPRLSEHLAWNDYGEAFLGNNKEPALDLIARATPEQEHILEGL